MSKITYYGFCGKCATRLIGHACLFAEQGTRVRIPDTEGISSLRLQPMNHRVQRGWQNSESSCISKVLFSMREIPACGENRSLEGLSWPGEKAEAMRLREKEDAVSETARLHAHEWISQKTYKKQNLRNTSITVGNCEVKKLSKGLHSEDLSQKR